jgi:hypothetical protein
LYSINSPSLKPSLKIADTDREERSRRYRNADEQEQTSAKKEKTTVYISHPTYPSIKAEAEAEIFRKGIH